jgi:hypothetical protein
MTTRRILALALVGAVSLPVAYFLGARAQQPPAPTAAQLSPQAVVLSPAARERVNAVLDGVSRFQLLAFADYRLALARYAAPNVVERFRNLDHHVWPEGSRQFGWSYFMHVSAPVVGGAEGETPLVAFYNPWVDFFLITAWEITGGGPRMIDAELLIGDWIRKRGSLPFDFTPSWLRGNVFRPAALGIAVAEALRAFETVFPPGEVIREWRQRLPGLESTRILVDQNYVAAGHHLPSTLLALDAFNNPAPGEDQRLAPLRSAVEEALRLATSGQLPRLLQSATDTLPATRTLLLDKARVIFDSLRVVAVIADPEASLVFLVPLSRGEFCVSFLLTPQGGRPRLSRIDVVDYATMFAMRADAVSAKESAPR